MQALEKQLELEEVEDSQATQPASSDALSKRPVNTPGKPVGPSPNQAPLKKTRQQDYLSPCKPLALTYSPAREEDAQLPFPPPPPAKLGCSPGQELALTDPYADTYVEEPGHVGSLALALPEPEDEDVHSVLSKVL